jgi:hypothetical protein
MSLDPDRMGNGACHLGPDALGAAASREKIVRK